MLCSLRRELSKISFASQLLLLKREIGRERERESKKGEGLRENIGRALQLEKEREREG